MKEGYKKTELGVIPKEWEIKSIGNSVLVNPESLKNSIGDDFTIDYIDIESVKVGKITATKQFQFKDAPSRARRIVRKDDVIISTVRPNLKSVAKIKIEKDNLICSTGFSVLRKKQNINSEYLYQFALSDIFTKQLVDKTVGSNYPAVNSNDIKETYIFIPTINEQQKIAEILSTVDSQIDDTDKLIEKTKELKKGLMQRLLTKGIGHSEFKKSEVGEIPVEWKVDKISNLVNHLKSGLSRSLKEENVGIPCIRSNNIKDNKLDLNDLKYWYEKDDKGANIEDYILKDGDIIINFINSMSQIGKGCIFNRGDLRSIYTTNLLRIQVDNTKMINKFFNYYIQTERYKREVMLITKPAVNQASFTTVEYKAIKFPVPRLDEQIQIVNILSSVDTQISEYENKKLKLEELKKGLMQQLLTGKIRVV